MMTMTMMMTVDGEVSFSQPIYPLAGTLPGVVLLPGCHVQRYRGRAALLGTFMRQSPRALVSMRHSWHDLTIIMT